MMAKAGLMTAQAFASVRQEADSKGMKFSGSAVILQVRMSQDARRIGYIVSRKCGNAVRRNRIKRRLRSATAEAFGEFGIETGDFVLIGRKYAYDCSYAELLGDIKQALGQYKDKRRDYE